MSEIIRLLCCSDTHGQVPAVIDETGASAWLHAGDIANGPDVFNEMAETDPMIDPLLAPVVQWFATRTIPVYAVRGNHDIVDCYRVFSADCDINGRVKKLGDGLWVAGVGWNGERHIELPTERDLKSVCDDVRRQARRIVERAPQWILLTHYPPKYEGSFDASMYAGQSGVWYDAVRELSDELKPILIVAGHNHRWFGQKSQVQIEDASTTIICPGPNGCIVDVDISWRRVSVAWQ